MSSPAQATVQGIGAPGSVPTDAESLLLQGQKIDERDRKEILETIDRVAAGNRLAAAPALFRINPTKKGFLFPLVVNIAAALAVVGGFAGSSIYFSKQQATISSQAGTFFSAEGMLVAQVRKEAEAKLKQKDGEIATIQSKLAQLDQESAALKSNMQATINAKEAALKAQMVAELAAEKARLGTLGISQGEVAKRLAAYEQQKNAQLAQAIDAYRAQSEASLAAKESQIQAQAAQSRQALALADQQRKQLETQAQQQEAALRAQYQAQTQKLQSANLKLQAESSAAQAKLQALAAQSQNEQLVSDQIIGSYSTILGDIRAAQYTKAQSDMNALKALLAGINPSTLPSIAKRRPVDLQLIASLEDLIKARTEPGRAAVDPAVVQRSDQVVSAEGFVKQAQTAEKSGNAAGAEELYARALGVIPAIEQAYGAMSSLLGKNASAQLARQDAAAAALKAQSDRKSAEITALEASLAQVRSALASNQKALEQARAALTQSQTKSGGLQTQVGSRDAKITALERQLASANGTVNELKSKLDSATASIAELQKEAALQKGGAGASAKQLQGALAENADLKQQLAAGRTKVIELESAVSNANAEIAQLQGTTARYASTIAALQGSYADYKARLLSLIDGGTPQDIKDAQAIFLKFIGGQSVEAILPGFSSLTSRVATSSVELARKSGNDSALNNVLLVTGYLSGNDGTGVQALDAKKSIAQKAASDPLFRTAAASIQRLAEQQHTASGRQAVATQYRLIGTVSFVNSNGVVVEKIVSTKVAPGDLVIISHKSTGGAEVPIAQGTVSQVTSASVTVTVQTILQGSNVPQLLDAVYLESRGA